MGLDLVFPDKYRLWNALVRGNTNRLFIPTEHRVRLADTVPINVQIGAERLPIVIDGRVIGIREGGRRFNRGVFVQIPNHELDKFRRFLGLQPASDVFDRARRNLRVHHEFLVRFVDPKTDEVHTTRNVSETGLFVTCPPGLACGQRVSMYLVLDDMPVALKAEVVWHSPSQGVAGLHIVEIGAHAVARLRETIESVRATAHAARTVRPIVIADDEPELAELMTDTLRTAGHDVYPCDNGDDALAMVRELHPELVLLDILMPGIDGADVCKVMRADAELNDIKVILVSALTDDLLHHVADESGATDYLSKPVRMGDLTDLVDHYLDRQPAAS